MSNVQVFPEVKLLGYTENPTKIIYYAARQCYKSGWVGEDFDTIAQDKTEQSSLIKKVLSSGHVSICEHVSFTFAIKGISRAESHQHVRHRIATYSQQSQRFCDSNGFDYIIPQNIDKDPEMKKEFIETMTFLNDKYLYFQNKLKEKYGKESSNEDARFILPNACETKFVTTMNCNSLIHFFELRCCMKAQWEIRFIANEMLKICKTILPSVFEDRGAKCVNLGYCNEFNSCGRYPSKNEVLRNVQMEGDH